jgi:two-component system, NarL family, sensor kinase
MRAGMTRTMSSDPTRRVAAQPPSAAEDAVAANRGIALLRLGFLPVALVELSRSHTELGGDLYPAVVALFAAYAVSVLVLDRSASLRPPPPLAQAVVDLFFITAMVYTSGGAQSPLRFAFYVLPIVAAVRLSPRVTAAWAGVALLAYLVVTVPHPGTNLSRDGDLLFREALALAWIGAAAVMLSALIARRERTLVELASSRRRLVAQSLDAEARERRRLAQALHDEAIQNLLVARQEVTDMARGVPGAAERAQYAIDETHRQLREEVFAMHPVGLERAGLAAVLRRLGDEAARRGGFEVHLDVDPAAADSRSDLVMFVGRELLANAAKHARASRVDIEVRSGPQGLRLDITDDGVGFPRERLREALADGHIGLAAVGERVRAAGGELAVHSDEGAGTRITAMFPASPEPLDDF